MKIVIVICLFLVLVGCEREAGKSLGDGYIHVDTNSYNTWVVRGHELIVDSDVTHALEVGEYIVGLRVKPERFVDVPEADLSDKYGYFVYDKTTDTLIEGLSEAEMKRIFSDNSWNYPDLVDATL